MENKYYLYRWVRLDKNIPFYIGIGTKTENDQKYGTYTRAHRKRRKNTICKNIVNNTTYEVEIMLESDDYNFIKKKEKEFIILYGRIDLRTGYLSNMTDGGEGTTGVVVSEYTRYLKRLSQLGKSKTKLSIIKRLKTLELIGYKPSKEDIRKRALSNSKSVMQYNLKGELLKIWKKVILVAEELNIKKNLISNAANLNNKNSFTAQNFIWIYTEDFQNNNFEKFNVAVQRAKQGRIKTFYTKESQLNIIEDYNYFGNYLRKEEKIKKLSDKYAMNYSTIRRILRNYELDNKISPEDNRYNRNKEIYNAFTSTTQQMSKNKVQEVSNKFHMAESSIREIVRKFKYNEK